MTQNSLTHGYVKTQKATPRLPLAWSGFFMPIQQIRVPFSFHSHGEARILGLIHIYIYYLSHNSITHGYVKTQKATPCLPLAWSGFFYAH